MSHFTNCFETTTNSLIHQDLNSQKLDSEFQSLGFVLHLFEVLIILEKLIIVEISFQTSRNPTTRITPLSSTLLSVRQRFQNGLSHTSCFSSLCVHRCRPLSHFTMRLKSFWNCIYIHLPPVYFGWVFLWFWSNTSNKKENIYATYKDFNIFVLPPNCHFHNMKETRSIISSWSVVGLILYNDTKRVQKKYF